MTTLKNAKEFSKTIESNVWSSPYLDLVIIQNGIYHTKNVLPSVKKDAGVLFNAIYDGDINMVTTLGI